MRIPCLFPFLAVVSLCQLAGSPRHTFADDLDLTLRHRVEVAEGTGRFHTLTRNERWKPGQTAIIVCDMWDLHHCLNAVRREGEFAPRLEQVLNTARGQGVTIIHAPSDCMDFYADHPARVRAQAVPASPNLPADIGAWCSRIPSEERGTYPIDQSDGGEDDPPLEHAKWSAELEARGRNPQAPWKRQIEVLSIDPQRDYITDRGDETWNILQAHGIQNVILAGVHTNMCVLGRPFGLRQMARNGKHVVLLRDLTDTMYNPAAWPFVSHFTGTDLIIEHIEKYVCPTITSDQIIDGEAFVFKNDVRPHVVFLIGEREYRTNETLPKFAMEQLGRDYRVSIVHASVEDPNTFPGIEIINNADLLVVSVRRRTPPPAELQLVRDHVAAGKPVVGIRTASHAFTLRNKPAPAGRDAWPEFDVQVFGGNYSNHHGNRLVAKVNVIEKNADHPILKDVSGDEYTSNGSLYVVTPLAEGTTPLLTGRVEGHEPEPMAWTFIRADGGRSFYTSLGYPDDFQTPAFVQMLKNAVDWAADRKMAQKSAAVGGNDPRRGWVPVVLPIAVGRKVYHQDAPAAGTPPVATTDFQPRTALTVNERPGGEQVRPPADSLAVPEWYRCYLWLPAERHNENGLHIAFPGYQRGYQSWVNGEPVSWCEWMATVPHPKTGLNTIVVRLTTSEARQAFLKQGVTALTLDATMPAPAGKVLFEHRVPLHGTWQQRLGDDPGFSGLRLPPQYAAAPDAIFEIP